MIESILHLSTAHLKPETWNELSNLNPYPIAFICPEEEWGAIIRICPGDLEEGVEEFPMPEDLCTCMVYAVKHDCGYIRFDCDVPVNHALPVYDWE